MAGAETDADDWNHPDHLTGRVRLQCVDCQPKLTKWRVGDVGTKVIYCAECGKKHSRDSLTVVGGR